MLGWFLFGSLILGIIICFIVYCCIRCGDDDNEI